LTGDGTDDLVTFTKNAEAAVHAALSTGNSFGGRQKWNDFFGLPGETSV
jgi:hypothetical protein